MAIFAANAVEGADGEAKKKGEYHFPRVRNIQRRIYNFGFVQTVLI